MFFCIFMKCDIKNLTSINNNGGKNYFCERKLILISTDKSRTDVLALCLQFSPISCYIETREDVVLIFLFVCMHACLSSSMKINDNLVVAGNWVGIVILWKWKNNSSDEVAIIFFCTRNWMMKNCDNLIDEEKKKIINST
jgi:hypothetical protein